MVKVGNRYATSTAIRMLEKDHTLRFLRVFPPDYFRAVGVPERRIILKGGKNPNGAWVDCYDEISGHQMGMGINCEWELLTERTPQYKF